MELNLQGQQVAVIGCASGIGRAIAEAFLAEGCEVTGFDRLADAPFITAGDVADPAALRAFMQGLPRLDHLVYAVGVGSGLTGFPYWNVPAERWSAVLEINLIAAVRAMELAGPRLAAQGSGSILLISSVAGQIGSPTDPPYSASKAALINFMQCAARDLGPHGVRVNALAPGMVDTPLNRRIWAASQQGLPSPQQQSFEDWAGAKIKRIAPLGRWQEASEMAAMACFLASEHARNITGQTLNIDGGQVMH